MSSTWQNGGFVYSVGYFGDSHDPIWGSWITRHTGITPDYMAQYEKREAMLANDEVIWELLRP